MRLTPSSTRVIVGNPRREYSDSGNEAQAVCSLLAQREAKVVFSSNEWADGREDFQGAQRLKPICMADSAWPLPFQIKYKSVGFQWISIGSRRGLGGGRERVDRLNGVEQALVINVSR